MASYVVMEPPEGGEEKAVLVRDGFHLLAFLLPVIWLLVHRLWIETLVFIVIAAALGALGNLAGFGFAASVASLVVALYVGMEGAALKLANYRRRGWREWGVVEADNLRDAEIRYLAETVGDDVREPASAVSRPAQAYRSSSSGPALGLFAYPPGRN